MKRRTYPSLDAYLSETDSTQAQLAEKLRITQSALSMIKSGQRIPRPALALRIHRLTGVPLETLLLRREELAS